MADLSESLQSFVTYVQTHLTGDEKGESADFLDHFFRSLGHDGIKEAGATRETRLAKKGGGKGKNFADLLWPERVLFEMKSRGKKLERQYDQIFDYWTHIVPHRPSYVILCNFDEFWIYDFNQQLFDPVEKIALADLPTRAEALAFLLPKPRKPLFNNNRVEVTREAAADLARLFRALIARGEDRARAQRFVLQLLVTLVSEDMNLLPRQILARLIAECREKGESSYDLIGGLFRQMNTKDPARGGRFMDVPYFNGGLFFTIDPIDLLPAELDLLAKAADRKWDMVKPEIFGTLFQASMDDGAQSGRDERHAFGAHFTSEFDIRKVVGPTIVRPWREKMAAAWDRVGALKEVLRDLRLFRVLDPACGSGNFLYVAYRELKRLEREILLRLSEISKGEPLESAVSIHQFFGIDIQPFAVELAKVTLMLAKEQEIREAEKLRETEGLLVLENPLPLDNLDKNILCADALFTEWPKADAIVGNPPYLGSRYIAQELGYDYARRVQDRFPGIPKMADFCTHWFRLLAHRTQTCHHREGGRTMKSTLPVSLASCLLLLASPTAYAIVDVNNNGVSDLWEKRYNDGQRFTDFDPEDDPDGDGWTNAQEAAAGTAPFDANLPDGFIRPNLLHFPAVFGAPDENGTPVVITPEAVTVTWPTLVGKKYTLLVSVDLLEGHWIAIGDSFIGSESEVTYGFEINESDKHFWRVAVADADSDDDGLTDAEEAELGSNSGLADTDFDGINDSAESAYSTSLILWDSDGDGSGDGEEISEGKDPVSAASFPPQWRHVERMLHYGFGEPVPEDPPPYSHLVTQQLWDPVSTSVSDLQEEIGWTSLSTRLTNDQAFPANPSTPRRIGLGSWTNGGAVIPSGEPPKYATLRDRRYWLVIDSPKETPVAKNFLKFTRRMVNADAPVETVELKSAIVPTGELASSPVDISTSLTSNPAFSSTTSQHETVLIQNLDISVNWKALTEFDNVDDHVDPWDKPIHGKRIFPDLKNPDATELQHKLEVIVKTSPALAGKAIFVKAFDVDDSTSDEFDREENDGDPATTEDAIIDTNEKSGGDNLPDYLGTGQNGHFWTGSAWGDNTAQGVVDANGETKFVFRVGMQPGNNYRIVASVIDESMYAGVQTTDSTAASYLGPELHQNGGAPASSLLTVWRRLWVENDSMGERMGNGSVVGVPTDVYENKLNDLHATAQVPTIIGRIYREAENLTEFEIPEPADMSSFTQLEIGFLKIQGDSHSVKKTEATWPYDEFNPRRYYVSIQDDYSTIPVGSGFRLYDDDDLGLIQNPLPRLDLVSQMFKSRFNNSFIEPIDAVQYNDEEFIPFALNKTVVGSVFPLDAFWEQNSDLEDKNECWVGRLIAAYQDKYEDDVDPWSGEGLSEGLTPGFRRNFSVIYVETIRDEFGALISKPPSRRFGLELMELGISLNAAHEISHMAGFEPTSTHHAEGGLMADQIDVNISNPAKFNPVSVKRMRKTTKWQKP